MENRNRIKINTSRKTVTHYLIGLDFLTSELLSMDTPFLPN